MLTEVSKTLNSDLYPDLQQVGGLAAALQRVLQELRTDLIVEQLNEPQFIVWAAVRLAERSSQVMVAAHERAFNVDFWNQGVMYGDGWVRDLKSCGRGIVAFHVDGASIQEMSLRFEWFKAKRGGLAHEDGPEHFVAEAWRSLADHLKKENENPLACELLALVVEAALRPKLQRLLPFRSLDVLCFSRTTGYPYTQDCPVAYPIGRWHFRVMSPVENRVLGEGDAVRAADLLVANLPEDCGPAVHGTADRLKE